MEELRKSRRRLCLPRERNLKPVTQPIHVIFLQSRGVYFSRNFNSKPVLHNYPDLFKNQGGYRSDSVANRRPLLRLVTKKIYTVNYIYIFFLRSFPEQRQNVSPCAKSSRKYLHRLQPLTQEWRESAYKHFWIESVLGALACAL